MTKLFSLIDTAKNIGSYALANARFAALIDVAMDDKKKYTFFWESNWGKNGYDYYALLTISDGLSNACIPVPLLRNKEVFRVISVETTKMAHFREGIIVADEEILPTLKGIFKEILEISPNAINLQEKYLKAPYSALDFCQEQKKKT